MGRHKGSRNKATLAKMGLDKYKINKNPQNDGKPKRIRRTREQLITDGYYNDKKVEIPK